MTLVSLLRIMNLYFFFLRQQYRSIKALRHRILYEAIMNYLKINYMIVLGARFVIKGKCSAVLSNCPQLQQNEKFMNEKCYF